MKNLQILTILLLFNRIHANETHLQSMYRVNKEVLLQRDIPKNWLYETSNAINFNQAIQLHLASVIDILRQRNVQHLSRVQQLNRINY